MFYLYRYILAFVLRLLGLKKKAVTLKPIPTIPTIPDLIGRFKDSYFFTARRNIHATHYTIK